MECGYFGEMGDSMDNKQLYNSVHNYTKFKLVEMLIEKYKDKNIDNLNQIEQMADDVLKVLAICGLRFHNQLKEDFDEERN